MNGCFFLARNTRLSPPRTLLRRRFPPFLPPRRRNETANPPPRSAPSDPGAAVPLSHPFSHPNLSLWEQSTLRRMSPPPHPHHQVPRGPRLPISADGDGVLCLAANEAAWDTETPAGIKHPSLGSAACGCRTAWAGQGRGSCRDIPETLFSHGLQQSREVEKLQKAGEPVTPFAKSSVTWKRALLPTPRPPADRRKAPFPQKAPAPPALPTPAVAAAPGADPAALPKTQGPQATRARTPRRAVTGPARASSSKFPGSSWCRG